ncbi:MAG: ABC transporter permease [Tissierellia bacterium]|nr:ABC transporter permease [Tissierellia bacterium]
MMIYIGKKLVSLIIVLFFASIVCFLIIHFIPGDPAEAMAGPGVSKEDVEMLRVSMGLDKPLIEQYTTWIGNIILHGDFGKSLTSKEPVADLMGERFVNTLILAACGIFLAIIIGIPLGIISAIKQNSVIDLITMGFSILGVSMPIFWVSLILILVFSVNLKLLPATGSGTILHLILPSIAIGLNSMAVIARMTRSSILEVLRQDYIRTADAKGMSYRTVIIKHALRNAMIPIITTIGIQFGYLLGGAVLTETVFVYPGIGRLLVNSINRRDYTTVQGCMLVITGLFVILNTVIDLLYHFLDPRIKNI